MILKNKAYLLLLNIILLGLVSCGKDNDSTDIIITVSTSDFSINIDENPTSGQSIGIVSGSTNQGVVSFTITEQTPNSAFTIDSNTGELKVANELLFDFEINLTITGVVNVSNGTHSENSNITINLNDLDEEKIYKGDVILDTQSDLDAFGVENYTEITGNLLIGSSLLQITNYEPISALTIVGGTLYFGPSSTNFDGLNISTVGDYLRISNNTYITNVNGLSSIENVGGGIILSNNTSLSNIDGLSNINSLNGRIDIWLNPSLINISGLQNISEGVSEIAISSNDQLANIDGLISISSTESVGILGNDVLNDINGISNITSIDSNLSIINNASITDVNALNNLTTVGGYLKITENTNLTDLCGLQPLLINSGLSGLLEISSNGYNPTEQQIIDGDCSL